jgi:hypothetical protein
MAFGEMGDLSPWDAGKLRAHQFSASRPTEDVRGRLEQARSDRRGWLCRIMFWRRPYLDGFIDGLQHELDLRMRDASR